MLLAFDDCQLVHQAPRWLAPVYIWLTLRIGEQRVLRFFARLPTSKKRIGIFVCGKVGTTISPDLNHCLVMRAEWKMWLIHRATSDLQRYGWHGLQFDAGTTYVADNLLKR